MLLTLHNYNFFLVGVGEEKIVCVMDYGGNDPMHCFSWNRYSKNW